MNLKTSLAPYKKTALSFGGLFSAFECFFAVFIYTWLRMLAPAYGVALIAGLTAAVSVALVPAVHSTVNRIRSVVMGRYHGALILSTLVAALMCCLLFSIPPRASMAYKVSISVLTLLFLCLSIQTFSYCVFSITVRVTDQSDRFVPLLKGTLSALSAVTVVALMYFYFDYSAAGVEKMAYIVGVFVLAAGCCVYFSTYTVIPKLVKTEPRAFMFKADYRRFFRPSKAAAYCYAGRYLCSAALLTVSLSAIAVVGVLWKLPAVAVTAALTAAAVVAAILRFAFFRGPAEPAHYAIFSIVGSCLLIAGVTSAVVLPLVLTLTTVYAYVALCVCAGVCGGAYAFLSVAFGGYMEHTYSISGVTRGTHKCLKGMLTTAAAATAVVTLSVTDAANVTASPIVTAAVIAAAVAAFCIAGAVLSAKGERLGNVQKS